MSSPFKNRSLPLLGIAALLANLVMAGECLAQKKSEAQKVAEKVVKEQQKEVKKAAKVVLEAKEVEALKVAYLLVAGGNHDYDGHRAKAMGQIEAAGKILDIDVLKHGDAKQKYDALVEDKIVARAKTAVKVTPTLHMAQAKSDAQLNHAGKMLLEVRAAAANTKQTKVVGHLDAAIKELNVALKIR